MPLPTYPAADHLATWRPYNLLWIPFGSFDCRLHVDLHGDDDELVSVVLLPNDEVIEESHWPVDVLALPPDCQGWILYELSKVAREMGRIAGSDEAKSG